MWSDSLVLWLTEQKGVRRKHLAALLAAYPTEADLQEADAETWAELGLPAALFRVLHDGTLAERAEARYHQLMDADIRYLSLFHPDYPALLKEIYDPPLGIYLRGHLPPEDKPRVAIVGSRRCTERAEAATHRLAKELAENGVVVVGGMARGIDSAGHAGCLDGGGETMAVLGCGVNVCYPPENHRLLERILQNGCVLSEYPPDTRVQKSYFPERNRIMAGLCPVTVVAEAAEKSGAFHTVNEALSNGREVMAVPGPIYDPACEGSNRLLSEGAGLVLGAADILAVLGVTPLAPHKPVEKPSEPELESTEQIVYDGIGTDPVTLDALLTRTGCAIESLQFALTMLEMKGYIRQLPGTRYIRVK